MSRQERGQLRPGFMENWDDFERRREELEAAMPADTMRSKAPRMSRDWESLTPFDETTTPYVELHLHSSYSLLDGASRVDELVWRAKELGYHALALTDHNGMFGTLEFASALREAELHSITGLEVTVAAADDPEAPRSHLTLLSENRRGYGNLCRLASIAYGLGLTDQREKQDRRRDPWLWAGHLRDHAEGLIVLTGCREGRVPSLVARGELREARAELDQLVDWFGRDQVFVELQDNLVFGDRPRNHALVALAAAAGVQVVGTGDVHYHERERHQLQDILVSIKHRQTLDESHRVRRPNAEFYLRSPEEQARRFAAYHPQAAANSVRIAARCTFDLTEDLGYKLPAPPMPAGMTPLRRLEQLCRERIGMRYQDVDELQEAEQRLIEELRLIKKHDLAGFFLVYHEIFELAEEVALEVRGASSARGVTNLPVGRGRGSSVSSIICYLIGLSHIDPVRNHLFIGRFLNEEMHSLPDIDLDFPRDIRARLIERVYERWGKEHAALVATLPTFRVRSAIRDVGMALGLPAAELDRLAKRANGFDMAASLAEDVARYPEFADRLDARGWRDFFDIVQTLEGFPRHLSQHPGGMVISSDPLIDYVPCQPAAWEGRYLCHWDKDSIDDARIVKIDFLALGMLSAVEEMVELIASERGELVDLSRINFEDEAIYDDICVGDTVGVFQVESRAQIAMLPRTRPRNLEDLAIEVAIVRPGPIVGGAVNPYVKRRVQMREQPDFVLEMPHPLLEEPLRETLGVVIFQEQVLMVAEAMGGFTSGEADQFRRAMSRRRSREVMDSYRERFMAGAEARDVPLSVAERIFDNLLGFAEFGFPKSHAAAFGLLAYQSTWLKHYYAAEFYTGLYNNQPMGFYPPHVLTNDAKRHGVQVLRPDVNLSDARCTVAPPEERAAPADAEGALRVGLGYVQGVGEAGGTRIERERARHGDYRSLFDFVQRTGIARQATANLIRVGAFDDFGLNQRELIWQLGLLGGGMQRALLREHEGPRQPEARQMALELPTAQDEVTLPDFDAYERMAADYELINLSPDSHPMQFLRPALGEGVRTAEQLRSQPGGSQIDLAGLVVCRQRPLTAKGIVFLLLEDESGMVNVLVNKDLAERERLLMRTAAFIKVRGRLEQVDATTEQRTLVAYSLEEVLPTTALRTPMGKAWG